MKKIHYLDQGPRDAEAIILIHAFPLDHTLWTSQAEALSQKYRVITYDLRGFGQSEVGNGQYTIELYVDDLITLLDELKISQVKIGGISLGGYVALRAVERNPERFMALILADTKSEADSNEAKLKRFALLKLLQEKKLEEFTEGFLKSSLSPEAFANNPGLVQKGREIILRNSPLGIGGALLALAARTDTTESLAKIKIPTLILVGEKDTVTPPAAALSMKEKIPNAQMHIISRAGHLSNLENPEEFNQRLMDFLS